MPAISVTLFVELLAVLTTGYLVTVSCLFLGYFLRVGFHFVGIFSVFDFTSQAVIMLPVAMTLLLLMAFAADAANGLAQKYKIPFTQALQGFAILGLVALAMLTDGGEPGRDYTGWLLLILMFAGGALIELRSDLAGDKRDWTSIAAKVVSVALAAVLGLGLVGFYWADVELQGQDTLAFQPKDGACIDAMILKSSASGVLIVNRSAGLFPLQDERLPGSGWANDFRRERIEFHPFESVSWTRRGTCRSDEPPVAEPPPPGVPS